MTYELIQSALTLSAEAITLLGISGIIAHAIYTSHASWLQTYCPPVKNFEPETEEEVAIALEPEQTTVEEVLEATEPTEPEQPQINLNALDPTTLRKLCTQHGIAWKGVRGKNRHATKAMMIFQLNQKAVA